MEINNDSGHRYHVILLQLNALEKENCLTFARSYVEKWAEIKAGIPVLAEDAQKATVARRLAKEAERVQSRVRPSCFFGGSALVMPVFNTIGLAALFPTLLDTLPVPRAVLVSFWSLAVVGNTTFGIYDFKRERAALYNLSIAASEMSDQASRLLPENYDVSHSDSV